MEQPTTTQPLEIPHLQAPQQQNKENKESSVNQPKKMQQRQINDTISVLGEHGHKKKSGDLLCEESSKKAKDNKGQYVISYNFDENNMYGITRNIFIGWDDEPTAKPNKKQQNNVRYNSLNSHYGNKITNDGKLDKSKNVQSIYHNKQKLNQKTPVRNRLMMINKITGQHEEKQNNEPQLTQRLINKQRQQSSLLIYQSNCKSHSHSSCVKCSRQHQHSLYHQNSNKTKNMKNKDTCQLNQLYNTQLTAKNEKTYIPVIHKTLNKASNSNNMGGGVNKKENVENMEHKDSIELPNLDKGNKENQDNNRYSLKKNGSNSHSILKPIQNPIQKTLRRNDTQNQDKQDHNHNDAEVNENGGNGKDSGNTRDNDKTIGNVHQPVKPREPLHNQNKTTHHSNSNAQNTNNRIRKQKSQYNNGRTIQHQPPSRITKQDMNNSNSPIKAKNINTNASNPNNVNNKNMSRAGKNTGATDMSAGNNKKKGTEEGKTIQNDRKSQEKARKIFNTTDQLLEKNENAKEQDKQNKNHQQQFCDYGEDTLKLIEQLQKMESNTQSKPILQNNSILDNQANVQYAGNTSANAHMNEGTDDGNKNSNNLHNSSIVDANSIKTNKNANEKGGNNKTKLINDDHSNHKISLNNNTKNCDVTNNNKNTNRNSHIEKVTQKRASKQTREPNNPQQHNNNITKNQHSNATVKGSGKQIKEISQNQGNLNKNEKKENAQSPVLKEHVPVKQNNVQHKSDVKLSNKNLNNSGLGKMEQNVGNNERQSQNSIKQNILGQHNKKQQIENDRKITQVSQDNSSKICQNQQKIKGAQSNQNTDSQNKRRQTQTINAFIKQQKSLKHIEKQQVENEKVMNSKDDLRNQNKEPNKQQQILVSKKGTAQKHKDRINKQRQPSNKIKMDNKQFGKQANKLENKQVGKQDNKQKSNKKIRQRQISLKSKQINMKINENSYKDKKDKLSSNKINKTAQVQIISKRKLKEKEIQKQFNMSINQSNNKGNYGDKLDKHKSKDSKEGKEQQTSLETKEIKVNKDIKNTSNQHKNGQIKQGTVSNQLGKDEIRNIERITKRDNEKQKQIQQTKQINEKKLLKQTNQVCNQAQQQKSKEIDDLNSLKQLQTIEQKQSQSNMRSTNIIHKNETDAKQSQPNNINNKCNVSADNVGMKSHRLSQKQSQQNSKAKNSRDSRNSRAKEKDVTNHNQQEVKNKRVSTNAKEENKISCSSPKKSNARESIQKQRVRESRQLKQKNQIKNKQNLGKQEQDSKGQQTTKQKQKKISSGAAIHRRKSNHNTNLSNKQQMKPQINKQLPKQHQQNLKSPEQKQQTTRRSHLKQKQDKKNIALIQQRPSTNQFADTDSDLQVEHPKSRKSNLEKSQAPKQITCISKRSSMILSSRSIKNNDQNSDNSRANKNALKANQAKNTPPKATKLKQYKNTSMQYGQDDSVHKSRRDVSIGTSSKNICNDMAANNKSKGKQASRSEDKNQNWGDNSNNDLVSFGNITCLPQLQPVHKQSFLQIDNVDKLNNTDFPPTHTQSLHVKQRKLNNNNVKARFHNKSRSQYTRAPILSFIYGQEKKIIEPEINKYQKSSQLCPFYFNKQSVQLQVQQNNDIIFNAIKIILQIDSWLIDRIIEPYSTTDGYHQIWLFCNGHWKPFLNNHSISALSFLRQVISVAAKKQYKCKDCNKLGIQQIIRMITGLRVLQLKNKKKLSQEIEYHLKKGNVIKGISIQPNRPTYNVTNVETTAKMQKLIQIRLDKKYGSQVQEQQQEKSKDSNILWIKQQTFQRYFDYFLLICHRQESYWTSRSLKHTELGQTLVYTMDSIKNSIGSLQVHTNQKLSCKIDFYRQIKPKILKFVGTVNEKNKPNRSIQNPNSSLYFNFAIKGRYYILLKLSDVPQKLQFPIHMSVQSNEPIQIEYLQSIEPQTLKNSTSQYIQINNKKMKTSNSLHKQKGSKKDDCSILGKSSSKMKQTMKEEFINYIMGKETWKNSQN